MNRYLSFIFLVLIFFACSEDETLEPSNIDLNWFERFDNPDSEVDHEIYQVYNDTKIAILYNDTIASQERGLDNDGNKIIYYNKVDLNYSLYSAAVTPVQYTLLDNDADILAGVKFVKENYIDKISEKFYPNSILLTDELYSLKDGYIRKDLNVYRGFNCLAIGGMKGIHEKTEEQKAEIAQSMMATTVATKLPDLFSASIKEFYKLSYSAEWKVYFFGMSVDKNAEYSRPTGNSLPFKLPEEYGFIKYTGEKTSWGTEWYNFPNKYEDLLSYVIEVIKDDEEDFKARYKNYAVVMEKYRYIKQLVENSNILK